MHQIFFILLKAGQQKMPGLKRFVVQKKLSTPDLNSHVEIKAEVALAQ